MNNQHCPVLWGFYRQLRASLTFANSGFSWFDVDDLEDDIKRAISTHEYSQLRAFLIVEDMLGRIDDICKKRLKPSIEPALVLRPRSWERLSQIKTNLVKLQEDAELTVAECKLEGTVVSMGGDVEIILAGPGTKDSDRISAARLVAEICSPTIEAIRSLRPYLRNEDAIIQNVSTLYVQFLRPQFGSEMAGILYNMMKQLLGVRL